MCNYHYAMLINKTMHSAMREQYMRNGEGFVLVYSITSVRTFEQVQKLYDQIARVKDLDSFPVILIGNKCDIEQDRQVPTHGNQLLKKKIGRYLHVPKQYYFVEGKALAKHYGCQFLETSAKQRIRIDETFFGIVREIRRLNEEKENDNYQFQGEKDGLNCCHECIIL